jgi:hypothetical protein
MDIPKVDQSASVPHFLSIEVGQKILVGQQHQSSHTSKLFCSVRQGTRAVGMRDGMRNMECALT